MQGICNIGTISGTPAIYSHYTLETYWSKYPYTVHEGLDRACLSKSKSTLFEVYSASFFAT